VHQPGGLLDDSTRENIAKEITRIHCDATGARASFVDVLFHETQEGRYFVEGQRSGHSIVFGAIRQGRTVETRQAMLTELSQMWTRYRPAGSSRHTHRSPCREHEQAWFDENSARLTEVGMTSRRGV
jgi:phenylpyruvate tautomerase PptA (4-oxalocrotonate tautomerase family)